MRTAWVVGVVGIVASTVFGSVAWAAGEGCEAGAPAPTAREIQRALDAYLGDARADVTLVGGPGAAGYDGAFWIDAGPFSCALGLAMQTRWEGFDWDDTDVEPSPGGDLSGFSLPRLTLRMGGTAPCCISWFTDVEFGHPFSATPSFAVPAARAAYVGGAYGEAWETGGVAWSGWIGYGARDEVTYRNLFADADPETATNPIWRVDPFSFGLEAGLVPVIGPRQIMTPAPYQLFVDYSLGAAWAADQLVGFEDRIRDTGLRFHGGRDFGRSNVTAIGTITNGDWFFMRNVLDEQTDDHVAFGGRVDWNYGHRSLGFAESLGTVAYNYPLLFSLGVWAYSLHHARQADRVAFGVDMQARWRGFSYQGGYQWAEFDEPSPFEDYDGSSWYVQFGYQIPGSRFEVGVRASGYEDSFDASAVEYGVGVNYNFDGIRNRFQLDATKISGLEDGNFFSSPYPGYQRTADEDATMIRFQWQYMF